MLGDGKYTVVWVYDDGATAVDHVTVDGCYLGDADRATAADIAASLARDERGDACDAKVVAVFQGHLIDQYAPKEA